MASSQRRETLNTQEDRLQGSMIVLHGPPKVGKTQFASRFPSPIQWVATEFGHKYIPDEQKKNLLQLDPDKGWANLKALLKKELPKVKTVIIDTASGLYDCCMRFVCSENGWSHPSDPAHGKGWNAVKREMFYVLSLLVAQCQKMKATLLIIDHSKQETIETTTSNIEKVACAMPGQARGILLPIPDHIWFLGYNEKDAGDALKAYSSQRALFVSGSSAVEAGCRDPMVKIKVIEPLSKKDPYQQVVKSLYGTKDSEE